MADDRAAQAPEVVPAEVLSSTRAALEYNGPDHPTLEPRYGNGASPGESSELEGSSTVPSREVDKHVAQIEIRQVEKKNWWRRKRFIITAVLVAIVAVISVIVGCVVGLRQQGGGGAKTPEQDGQNSSPKHHDDPEVSRSSSSTSLDLLTPTSTEPPDSTQTPSWNKSVSACNNNFCRQIFSAASMPFRGGSGTDDASSIWVFARGGDKNIWYREGDGTGNWTSPWITIPGEFESPPSAASVGSSTNTVVTVFAVDAKGEVQVNQCRGRQGTTNWTGWQSMRGQKSRSHVGLCVEDDGNEADPAVHAWGSDADKGGAYHWYYTPSPSSSSSDLNIQGNNNSVLDYSAADKSVSSIPAATCRGNTRNPLYDFTAYAYGNIRHRYLDGEAGKWSDWVTINGQFVADPVVVYNNERTDIFAVGKDKAMYHLRWRVGDKKFAQLTSLNGSFESVPSVLMSDDGNRIDVVALGTDHMLKHRTWLESSGGGWAASEWEDLEVFANSAPLAYTIKGKNKDRTALMVLGYNSEMNYTSWEVQSSSTSWKGLGTWQSAGGRLTSRYLPQFATDV